MQAVPGAHPQLLLVRQRVLAVGLGSLSLLLGVHARLLLLSPVLTTAAVPLTQGLGNVGLGADAVKACGAGAKGAAGDACVEVDVHRGGKAHARPVSRAPYAVEGEVFLMGDPQLVQFLELLAQAARGAHLEVVGVAEPPGADDGAVLGEVDVPVDVAVAVSVGHPEPLGLAGGVVSCGAALVVPVHH